MSLKVGIVGLPNVGKSTLFAALTRKQVDIANYPFCTIEPNVGVVEVPDERLAQLATVSKSAKIIPTVIEFVDIAGLVAGAHEGQGLGNKFLSHIREVDTIVHVVRLFADSNVVHVAGALDAQRDYDIITTELVMADLVTVTKRAEAVAGRAKSGDPAAREEHDALSKLQAHLNEGQPARNFQFSISNFQSNPNVPISNFQPLDLLTAKPEIVVYNAPINTMLPTGLPDGIVIDIKLEHELVGLDDTAAREMMASFGLAEPVLARLIKTAYQKLGLITYLTSGPKETRAWTIPQGTKAPQAAGVIHTDFEKGFIRAEVTDWQDFVAYGEAGCKSKGLTRTEGRDYVVHDGDVVYFLINT